LLSLKRSLRSRRVAARVAIAGALAVVPLAAVAGPALADTTAHAPAAAPIDWRHHGWDHGGGGWDHGGGWHHHGWDHGDGGWNPGWNPGWGGGLPDLGDLDTGSAG